MSEHESEFPVDHRLGTVYRVGGGLVGLALVIFGVIGLVDKLPYFAVDGQSVLGLSSNGLLSIVSVVVGALLLVAALIGRNLAAHTNVTFGILFLVSGLVNICLLRTELNYFGFKMQNVIFSFVVGLMLLTFGFYGRVSGKSRNAQRTDEPAPEPSQP
ncbi:DUF4383 domain-containing protein [Fodinicola acaciae]|uniref:DUF4383 domain-containing protein n=1 Tax=Fodinicola acaciae TaxID=2681555 RepID=UPI0013D4FA33|nr:DUF4383 domain-containing protein [Fodinicola acaciae]